MTSKRKDVVDMISNLPDPILNLILSGLPTTEEVIRTSILSTRWRYLWTSIPSIDIDLFRGLIPHEEFKKNVFEDFVCHVLANKSIDLDSFRLSCGNLYNMSTVGRWIDVAVSRNVKVLDLMFCTEDEYDVIELPHSLVTYGSLEVLKLSLFSYSLRLPKITGFLALKALELNSCDLLYDYELVNDFLKSCPLLEDLTLVDCETCKLYLFCISCPKLKNLRIDNRDLQDSVDGEYGIEGLCNRLQICCPNLVFLEFEGFMALDFIFENLDSLKKATIRPRDTFEWQGKDVCQLFAGISRVEYLSLRIYLIEKYINLEDFPESLPNLKTLELTTILDGEYVDVLFKILTCSPNMESLHIVIEECPEEASNLGFFDMEYTFKELKMVKVTGVSVVAHHIAFIELLLESTPFLETMSIIPCVDTTDRKLSFLTNKVLKFPRASPELKSHLFKFSVNHTFISFM